ncbi:MAG TPA: Gfo/Idh/MocA family oxidoreductase, partial [Ilumatobacter sp.]
MTTHINVALVGSKFMGRAHSNAWLNVGKFFAVDPLPTMHTVVARNPAELAEFAERWGWQHHSTDWRSTVTSDEIGLVDIGTPNNVHAEQAIAALEAGKHVACEKPLAGTLTDARAMVAAAAGSPGTTSVWFNYRR